MLATCCDARVMSTGDDRKGNLKPYVIGLNETKLGIVAPFWFVETLVNTVDSRRTAERMLQRGDLLTSEQALHCNLVDAIVPTADVMTVAEKEMKQADLKEIPTIEDVMFEEQDRNGKKGIVATLFSTSWIWK